MNFFGSKEIINDTSIKFMFGNNSNYLNLFENIHKSFNDEDFLEMKEIDIKEFTDAFLIENNVAFSDIKKNKSILENFVKNAKRETNITLTDLASFLGLSRNIVGYQYRKP